MIQISASSKSRRLRRFLEWPCFRKQAMASSSTAISNRHSAPCIGACLGTVAKNCEGRTRSGSDMRSRGSMVSVIRSSEVEEKEALKSLPLEGKRRFLPKVRFLVGGVLTQAAPAVRACFGGVLGMLAPGSRKEVEALGAVW